MGKQRRQLGVYIDLEDIRRLNWACFQQSRAVGHPTLTQSEMVRQMLRYALSAWEGVYGPPPPEFTGTLLSRGRVPKDPKPKGVQ